MNQQQLHTLDALTRAEAKNAREARRLLHYAASAVHTHTPEESRQATRALLRKTTPLMAYVRSLLPEGISNAELCRQLDLSDSTRRRLEKGESSPDEKTLRHLEDALHLTEAQKSALRRAAYRTHTRFGVVILCCCAYAIYDPVYVNMMLRKHLEGDASLYSPQDIQDYDDFEGDLRDWLIICRYRSAPLNEADAKVKAALDAYSKEISNPTPLLRHISLLIHPTGLRPGHVFNRCTLPKSTRDSLHDPMNIPSEKTLWKLAVGLRLNKRGAEDLFTVARREAENILKRREVTGHD